MGIHFPDNREIETSKEDDLGSGSTLLCEKPGGPDSGQRILLNSNVFYVLAWVASGFLWKITTEVQHRVYAIVKEFTRSKKAPEDVLQ